MDEQVFVALAGKALENWAMIIEDNADVDVDCDGSVLTVELDDGRTFVVNRNRPLRQIWLSSPVSGASHYDWKKTDECWMGTKGEGRLDERLAREVSETTGAEISFG
jgi:frataxin